MPFRFWNALSTDLNGIVKDIEREWIQLLHDTTKKERDYQSFLDRNAGFFWVDGVQFFVVGSQLSFGADLNLDFVRGFDRGSPGFAYELIEIESPHTPPYNSNGDPSGRLNHALQQIRDWKRWITANLNSEVPRIFPSGQLNSEGQGVFKYKIVIGRRSNSAVHLDRRNQLESELGVEVRSFDYLTDRLRHRIFVNEFMAVSPECKALSAEHLNNLVNPFNRAIPDARWRRMVKDPRFQPVHMICLNYELRAEAWQQSSLQNRFDAEWAELSEQRRKVIEQNSSPIKPSANNKVP
jgi:hypothetical protein